METLHVMMTKTVKLLLFRTALCKVSIKWKCLLAYLLIKYDNADTIFCHRDMRSFENCSYFSWMLWLDLLDREKKSHDRLQSITPTARCYRFTTPALRQPWHVSEEYLDRHCYYVVWRRLCWYCWQWSITTGPLQWPIMCKACQSSKVGQERACQKV